MKYRLSGEIAYLLGIAIAIVMSFMPDTSLDTSVIGMSALTVTVILVVLGFIIGLVNFRATEPMKLMAATLALIIASPYLDAIPSNTGYFGSNLAILSAPIAFVLALKILIDRARTDSGTVDSV
jgi:CRISPR/Cas system-associated exonuclease Cas4 (RecB family)